MSSLSKDLTDGLTEGLQTFIIRRCRKCLQHIQFSEDWYSEQMTERTDIVMLVLLGGSLFEMRSSEPQ